MPNQEITKLVYKELGDQIRHFSTIRSALTTFLLTVSLAAFSQFLDPTKGHPAFLIIAGFIAMLAGIGACLRFSYLTEKAVIRYRKIEESIGVVRVKKNDSATTKSADNASESLFIPKPRMFEVHCRMAKDWMNWVLLTAVVAVVYSFWFREDLKPILESLSLM